MVHGLKRVITVPAVVHPFAFALAFANVHGQAVLCLGHAPVYIVDDPKNICSHSYGYQEAINVFFVAFCLMPVATFTCAWLCATIFRKQKRLAVTYAIVHISGWVLLYFLARSNVKIVDWFMD